MVGLLRGLPWEGLSAGGISLDRVITLLSSETMRRHVVRRMDLVTHYESDDTIGAAATLDEKVRFLVTREGAIRIDAEDGDSLMAAKLANVVIDVVDSLSVFFLTNHATLEKNFLQTEMDSANARLSRAEEALKDFAVRTGVVALPAQLRATVTAQAELEAKAIDTRVRLRAARQALGPRHPTAKELEATLSALEHERLTMVPASSEAPRIVLAGSPESRRALLPLADAPLLAMTYGRLYRDVEMATIVSALLLQQLKRAEIREAKTIATIQIVDRAMPPNIAIFPQKRLIVMVSGFFGLALGILAAFTADRWPKFRAAVVGQP